MLPIFFLIEFFFAARPLLTATTRADPLSDTDARADAFADIDSFLAVPIPAWWEWDIDPPGLNFRVLPSGVTAGLGESDSEGRSRPVRVEGAFKPSGTPCSCTGEEAEPTILCPGLGEGRTVKRVERGDEECPSPRFALLGLRGRFWFPESALLGFGIHELTDRRTWGVSSPPLAALVLFRYGLLRAFVGASPLFFTEYRDVCLAPAWYREVCVPACERVPVLDLWEIFSASRSLIDCGWEGREWEEGQMMNSSVRACVRALLALRKRKSTVTSAPVSERK